MMPITIRAGAEPDELLQRVERLSGQKLAACYQCGTCAASCPFHAAMDLLPDAIIRHLLFGLPGLLERQAFWICVGCDSCAERCPRAIDLPRVMNALRQICISEGGDQLVVERLTASTLCDLPPIALVASLRRQTG
jgi:heterodisulfide reductase subunit C2